MSTESLDCQKKKKHGLGCFGSDSLRHPQELLEARNGKPHYRGCNSAYFLQTSWSSPLNSGEMLISPQTLMKDGATKSNF